jgi:phosphate transport system substrate-binding protein
MRIGAMGIMTARAQHLLARQGLPAVLALAALAVIASFSPLLADPLVVQGSTTFNRRLMEPHQAAIEAASGQKLVVIPNKSTPGVRALLEGRAQMAMISASLQGEIELLRKVMPDGDFDRLRAFEILSTRLAIGVHPSNPVRRTRLATITQILRGKIHNWKELGGPDLPIRVVLPVGGGAQTVVEAELLGGQPITLPDVIYVKTPVQLVQVVEQEPAILGFVQLPLARQRGITELVTDPPLQTTLSLVTLGEPTPAMRAVIDAARRVAEKMM